MVAELLFHLGDRKAGSSAIQLVLTAGAWAPADGSDPADLLLYPGLGSHNRLAQTLFQPDQAAHRDRRFAPVAAALAASPARLGVISAEDFETVAPATFARMLDEIFPDLGPRARLIAYVRPHAARFVSIWAERVKAGRWQGPPEAWLGPALDEGLLTYTPRFVAWRERFGARFGLRPMIRAQLAAGDVVQDFLGFALGRPVVLTGASAFNVSLPLEDLAVLEALHGPLAPLPGPLRATAGRRLARGLAADPAPRATRPALDRATLGRLAEACRADAAALDAAFFDGTLVGDGPMSRALEAALLDAPETAAAVQPGPHARLSRAFAALAAGLLAETPQRWHRSLTAARRDELAAMGGDPDAD